MARRAGGEISNSFCSVLTCLRYEQRPCTELSSFICDLPQSRFTAWGHAILDFQENLAFLHLIHGQLHLVREVLGILCLEKNKVSEPRISVGNSGKDRQRPASEGLALLRAIPIFAPLPPPTLERLAGALRPVTVAGGDVLFSAGDEGDSFYIVESGELGVDLATGQKLEGAGGWVGEIALLRDVPRTATVRARSDARLLALDRDEFLSAVTGHERTREAAYGIASERLALSPV